MVSKLSKETQEAVRDILRRLGPVDLKDEAYMVERGSSFPWIITCTIAGSMYGWRVRREWLDTHPADDAVLARAAQETEAHDKAQVRHDMTDKETRLKRSCSCGHSYGDHYAISPCGCAECDCLSFVEAVSAPSYQGTHGRAPGARRGRIEPVLTFGGVPVYSQDLGPSYDAIAVGLARAVGATEFRQRAAMQGMANVMLQVWELLTDAVQHDVVMFSESQRDSVGARMNVAGWSKGRRDFIACEWSRRVRAKVSALPKPGPRVSCQGEED